jgi:hypothetical protein
MMKSPFPGMDPYLEAHWADVHQRLIHDSCNALNRQLRGSLRARMGERVVVEQDSDPVRSIYPDVRVFEHGARDLVSEDSPSDSNVAVAEPLVVVARSEKVRQPFVEIIDIASGGRLITAIEFLSPSNKYAGDGQEQYARKQQEIVAADINLVEIDLLRGGQRNLLHPVAALPESHRTTYLACVRRGFGRDTFHIFRMPLTERLPVISIPLRRGDGDAVLDIQGLVTQAYEEGRYDDLDYAKPCIPRLEGAEAAWAEQLLRAAGKRP